jgi:hypothetical protein
MLERLNSNSNSKKVKPPKRSPPSSLNEGPPGPPGPKGPPLKKKMNTELAGPSGPPLKSNKSKTETKKSKGNNPLNRPPGPPGSQGPPGPFGPKKTKKRRSKPKNKRGHKKKLSVIEDESDDEEFSDIEDGDEYESGSENEREEGDLTDQDNDAEDGDSDISYHSSDDDPDDSEEVQELRKKVRALGKKRKKLIVTGPKVLPSMEMKISLNDLQEARVAKIENILKLEKDKLRELKAISAIREKATIVGEMKELEEHLSDLEMKRENMMKDLEQKKENLLKKLQQLQVMNGEDVTKGVTKDDETKHHFSFGDDEKDDDDDQDDDNDVWLRGRKNREMRNQKADQKSMMSLSPSSQGGSSKKAHVPASARGGTASVTSSVDNNAVRGYYNTFGTSKDPSAVDDTEVSYLWSLA